MAQLVAHLHGMKGVRGSNPLSSTIIKQLRQYYMVKTLCPTKREDSDTTVDVELLDAKMALGGTSKDYPLGASGNLLSRSAKL